MTHEPTHPTSQLDVDRANRPGERPEAKIVRTSRRSLKLAAAWLFLAVVTAASAAALTCLTAVQASTLTAAVFGATLAFDRLWLLAAAAGLLGGSVRGVFMLIVENYAFEYRYRTCNSSEWAIEMLGLETIDDDFDPLINWWAYLLKPVMGMGFGFFFGLLQLLGLIPFLKSLNTDRPDVSVAVVAALAGLLTEEALGKLKKFFARE
jgi:hypothetical protein